MTPKVTFGGVTPYLVYADANQALEWLERVLGFREAERYVDKDGVVANAHMLVGDAEVWIAGRAGHTPDPQRTQYLMVWVDDVDAQWERVKTAGVEVPEPADQTWGVRSFHVKDPGSYMWGFVRRLPQGYQQTKSLAEGGLREIVKGR